ncbi:serine phosphatase RsbU (regulator of sigma subunit) [Tamaricihabitans halophyticus]|uniref:Serine phosphatase RsbU (Regulator of sigma subunit) n=2 Tax=Tamaricihabitans halophyticus TaxID=1262583 RepID=A0A4R2Q1Y8_9PSEU|nr:serine phosphatase RsbU (regulator of sigma subunit) [Tamaricihabitans halophyticus]
MHYYPTMAASHDAEDRLRRFEAVTDTALAHLDIEQLLEKLLERVRELLQVDTAVMLQYELAANDLVATAFAGIDDDTVPHEVRVPVGEGVAGLIAQDRRAVVVDRADSAAPPNPSLLEKGLRIVLGAPMTAAGELIGVLQLGARDYRRFTEHDLNLLQVVADRLALASQAHLSSSQRAATKTLQRSLLPARLPATPGMAFAGRYVPGARESVGGDWYDVFELPGGEFGIVMGDVAGHGLPAAVVMGRLRSALRAYALETTDPGAVLDKLDRKATHFEANTMATVAYSVVEPASGRLRVSLAGHLPPLMAAPRREAEFLDVPVDPPIGVVYSGQRRSTTVALPAASVVCWYTDGLIERRDRLLDDGLEALRRTTCFDTAEALCGLMMSTFVDAQAPDDDTAILVMRRATS